jgi:hypothetical protein
MLRDVGSIERHIEEEPQRRHGAVDLWRARTARCQMQLAGAYQGTWSTRSHLLLISTRHFENCRDPPIKLPRSDSRFDGVGRSAGSADWHHLDEGTAAAGATAIIHSARMVKKLKA